MYLVKVQTILETNDASKFVGKPYLRNNYSESILEEDIDMKKQFKIKHLPVLKKIQMLLVNLILIVV